MKRVVVAIGFLFLFGFAIGQAQDGTAELQKTVNRIPAALIYLPYSPEVVKDALENYLTETNDAKGYLVSSKTLIVKNNNTKADMRFVIGLKDEKNSNESVIYLKLNQGSNNEPGGQPAVRFDMQNAKDYLNNLAVAIKPYATEQQLNLQQKNLSAARDKSMSLIAEGDKLEDKRKKLRGQIGENENRSDKALARKKARNDRLIDENLATRMILNDDIAQQISALALLTD